MANNLYLFTGRPNPNDIALRNGPSGTAYTLTGQVGALTLTGQSATMTVARALSGAARALTLTGQTATLSVGRTLSAAPSSLTLAGQSATLTVTRASVSYELFGDPSALLLDGKTAALEVATAPVAPTGSIVGSYQGHTRTIRDYEATPYNWPAPKLPDEAETVEQSPAPTPDVAPDVTDTQAPLAPIGISMPKDEWLVPYTTAPLSVEPFAVPSVLASLPTLEMGSVEPLLDDGAELAMALALIAVDDF